MKKKLLFVFCFLQFFNLIAQNEADIDLAFDYKSLFNSGIRTLVQQPDGKIIVGGDFTTYSQTPQNRLIRLNPDGSKDTTFSTGIGFDNIVSTISLQTDGKIIIGGSFTTYNGTPKNRIIRLNPDGSNDTTFSTGNGFDRFVNAIALQSDGKILIGGDFTYYNGTPQNRIIRLNSDGSNDTSFSIGNGFNGLVNSIIPQPNGKLIIGGGFSDYNGNTQNRIIILNPNGSKDTTFSIGIGFDNNVNTLALQPDGKIIVGGNFTSYNGNTENRLIRINANGSKDTSFTTGTGFNSLIETLKLQPDGKIIAGGVFTSFNETSQNHIIRLNTDGSKDTTFSIGTGFNNSVKAIIHQPNGNMVLGGSFLTYNERVQKILISLDANGAHDTNFAIETGFDNEIYALALQPDGKIVIGGNFTSYNQVPKKFLIRLNPNGTNDSSFSIANDFNYPIKTITLQPDGKIIVGGDFTTYNGISQNRIIRLNTDGSKDTTFSIGTGFDNSVNTITLQPDGMIIVGGEFTTYNGISQNRIIRLNSGGLKDTTFSIGTGFNNVVFTTMLQADGKIIVGGNFTAFKNTPQNRIIRLNPDGTKDTNFLAVTGFNNFVKTLIHQPDGKTIAGGNFTTYNGAVQNRLIRLNSDGTQDASFNIGSGFNYYINGVTLQPDAKLIAIGFFTTYNGTPQNRIIRLNSDGSQDVSFNVGTGFEGAYYPQSTVHAVTLQPDGKIWFGGNFTTYNATISGALVRLEGTSATLASEQFEKENPILFPNPVQNVINILLPDTVTPLSIEIYDIGGKLISSSTNISKFLDVSSLNFGVYILKIKIKNGIVSSKFIKS